VFFGQTHSQAGLEPPLPIQISTRAGASPGQCLSKISNFNPFDPEFRANPYPHFPKLLQGPPRQLNLFMPTTLVARYAEFPRLQLVNPEARLEYRGSMALRGLSKLPLSMR
jgi:hypothetical protein